MKTELWELDSFENDIIRPILSTHYQLSGLFLVDEGFCSKNWEEYKRKNAFKVSLGSELGQL